MPAGSMPVQTIASSPPQNSTARCGVRYRSCTRPIEWCRNRYLPMEYSSRAAAVTLARAQANTLKIAARYTMADAQPRPALKATSANGAELAPSVAVSFAMPNTMMYAINVKKTPAKAPQPITASGIFRRGFDDSFAKVAELSNPTKLKITNGSAEKIAPYLKDAKSSCARSITVPLTRTMSAVITTTMPIDSTWRMSPARDDN